MVAARSAQKVSAQVPARLLVIGGGKMGEALVGGLIARQWAAPDEIVVVEALAARRAVLTAAHRGLVVTDTVVAAQGAVIAVKPDDVGGAAELLTRVGVRRVVSIAAGITIARLQHHLGPETAVVRAMPNTPALVGQGCTGIAAGESAGADDLAWAADVLGSVGTVVQVSEPLLDAVTGLTGSGPAYLFLVAEALVDAGVLVGLARPLALEMVQQLFVGTAAMLVAGIGSPEQLRAQVTSPGGTTIAGLRELERSGLRSAFLDAVASATARSRELGE